VLSVRCETTTGGSELNHVVYYHKVYSTRSRENTAQNRTGKMRLRNDADIAGTYDVFGILPRPLLVDNVLRSDALIVHDADINAFPYQPPNSYK